MMQLMQGFAALLVAPPCLPTNNIMAQETTQQSLKMPTLEDLIPGGATYRFTENLYGLQWWGDRCIKPGIDSLFVINPKNGEETLLFTRDALNQALQRQQASKVPYLYGVKFPWIDRNEALITLPGAYAVYDWENNRAGIAREFDKRGNNIDFETTGMNVAYTIGNNLYVNGKAVTDEPAGIVCGQSVHRNEFGISKGTFWSPKGTSLAFYRMDESMVTEYPLVDITARVGELNPVRYPMAGMTSHKVQVGIYRPADGTTIYLETGDPTDRYFTNIAWTPDEKILYLIEVNRDQNQAKLCQYDAASGKLMATLYEETHPKYVEPLQPVTFLPWDNTQFIYQSQRDGWNHLYLMNMEKPGEYRQLTQGKWLVQGILGFNAKKKEIVFTATKESPLQSNLYKVNVNSGKVTALDNGQGVHDALLSASGSYLIDNWSAPEVPRVIGLLSVADGKETAKLFTAPDPFAGIVMPTVETGTLKAADGTTDLYWRMLKPADFDSSKKYPVIVYVYGGPHAQMIVGNYRYAARGWDLYMAAAKDCILFTVDNRGSQNRGMEFENCTFRHLGIEECEDQAKAVEWLKTLPYVDGGRIGVHGWSFGGHMTTALMLRYPDLYKVGVAGGPVIDWKYYEVMYGERYMDTPEQNPEGYKECDLKQLAGNLKGHLLIIHDDHDDTCVPQHTLSFLKACVEARTYPDFFVYPGHKHNVIGRDRVHLHEKITSYFEDYLLNGK